MELVGVVLILLPCFSLLGGLWIMATMFVAVLVNILVKHTNPVPPPGLFLIATVVVVLRFDQIRTLFTWGWNRFIPARASATH